MANYRSPNQWLETQPDWFAYGYRFNEIADAWIKVVGEENVGVFVFEELIRDSASFARKLCDFIGIDGVYGAELLANQHENVRKSQRTQSYVRLRSSFLPNTSLGTFLPPRLRKAWRRYLDKGKPSKAELPAEWQARIEEYYRSDNRKLAERFNLPLQDCGYPM
jgi:hypothetical protein